MLYAILIYGEEGLFDRLEPDLQEAAMAKHRAVQAEYGALGTLGPVVKLMGSSSAVTLRGRTDPPVVVDGPFAETKEHLLGLYVVECPSMEAAVEVAGKLPPELWSYEVRPVAWANVGDADSGS